MICLISKLNLLDVSLPLTDWFSSYLNNQLLRVRINFTFSQGTEYFNRVAQGPVLGPLFLIYIGDSSQQTSNFR